MFKSLVRNNRKDQLNNYTFQEKVPVNAHFSFRERNAVFEIKVDLVCA